MERAQAFTLITPVSYIFLTLLKSSFRIGIQMEGAQTAFYIAATVAMVFISLFFLTVFIQVMVITRKVRMLITTFETQVRKASITRLAAKVWLLELLGQLLGVFRKGGEGHGR